LAMQKYDLMKDNRAGYPIGCSWSEPPEANGQLILQCWKWG